MADLLSSVSVKTSRSSTSPMGTQSFSLRARQPEVAAFRRDPSLHPRVTAQREVYEWLYKLDMIALAPSSFRGRVPGLRRKPRHPINDFDKRMAWIADQLGWPVSLVTSCLSVTLFVQ